MKPSGEPHPAAAAKRCGKGTKNPKAVTAWVGHLARLEQLLQATSAEGRTRATDALELERVRKIQKQEQRHEEEEDGREEMRHWRRLLLYQCGAA